MCGFTAVSCFGVETKGASESFSRRSPLFVLSENIQKLVLLSLALGIVQEIESEDLIKSLKSG